MRTLFAMAALLTACTALFEDPVQCQKDADCAAFTDAVCGAPGICVSRQSQTPESSAVVPPSAETMTSSICPQEPRPVETLVESNASIEVTGERVLGCDRNFVLSGRLVVKAGATLKIQAGTRIDANGGGSIWVLPGARIEANGTRDEPVVFTSSTKTPGAWDGIHVLGRAPPTGDTRMGGSTQTWGGNDPEDGSGTLRYVRIEYGRFGLRLFGVGRKTDVEFVDVRQTGDDAYGVIGGTVRLRHLLCQYPGDECYQFDNGYDGSAQFLIAQGVRPDGNGKNGLLVDDATMQLSNVTLCGSRTPSAHIGLVLRNNARGTLRNVVITGYGAAVDVVGGVSGNVDLRSSIAFANHGANVAFAEDPANTDSQSSLYNDDNGFNEAAWFSDASRANTEADPKLLCFDPKAPVFSPEVVTRGDSPPNNGFFDVGAAYRGAVAPGLSHNDWARGAWVLWE